MKTPLTSSQHSTISTTSWLAPLPLPGGNILPNRIIPGPMEGIMQPAFCRIMADRGLVRSWLTPFIRISTGVPRTSRLLRRLEPFLMTKLPTLVQIMGTDIANLRDTASRLTELGVAGVDLNCACPSKTVIGNGAGGGRLQDPRWIYEALTALRQACPSCAVSVKLRTGFDSPDEMPAILEAAQAAGPDLIILHFRTVREQYRHIPDGWSRLARARELLPEACLFGSGDLFTPEQAIKLYRQTGLDGIAPARGLLKNPWLLRDIEAACKGHNPTEHSLKDKLHFLNDLANPANPPTASKGLLLEFAARLLGKDHPFYHAIIANPAYRKS